MVERDFFLVQLYFHALTGQILLGWLVPRLISGRARRLLEGSTLGIDRGLFPGGNRSHCLAERDWIAGLFEGSDMAHHADRARRSELKKATRALR